MLKQEFSDSVARERATPHDQEKIAQTSKETASEFRSRFGVQRFTPKQPLLLQGDLAGDLYEILEGTVARVYAFPDGRRQIVELITRGMVLGFPLDERHPTSAIAITNVRALRTSRAKYLSSDALQRDLAAQLQVQLRRSQEMVTLLGKKNAAQRIATFLTQIAQDQIVNTSDFIGSDLRLPISKTDLADYLCLRLETVTRAFARFESAGIIQRINRSSIVIIDVEQLTAIAQGALEFDIRPNS